MARCESMRDDSYARCVRTFSEGTTISLEASLDSSDVRWIQRGSFRRLKPSNAISSRAAQPTFEEASMIPHQHQRATRARLGHATALGPITILAWLALLPAVAHAQGTIAGAVKDTSGAILPGVTVEATSPALIEKVRSAVTDGAGLYRIENLRPGVYTVTFSLPGFATVRREGLELNAFLTITINAELKVGGVEETITVTGE